MAKAKAYIKIETKTTIEKKEKVVYENVEVIKEIPVKKINLTLTGPEAETLVEILCRVGGAPTDTPRGLADAVLYALRAAGVNHYKWNVESKSGLGGYIYFADPDAPGYDEISEARQEKLKQDIEESCKDRE